MSKRLKICTAFVMMLIMTFIMTNNVYAETTMGSYNYATVYGCQYKYYSSVSRNATYAWANVYVTSNEGKNYPAGYMGVSARLYDSSDSLITVSDWEYSASGTGGISTTTNKIKNNTTIYYGRGQVRMYNGNGYNTYTTTKTPFLQPLNLQELDEVYSVNENGEIYGPECVLNQYGIEPDLIQAIGDSGIQGYVKAEDLNLETVPTNPEEAIRYQQELSNQRIIPVYDYNGETIMDSFTIYYGNMTEI